MPSVAICHLRWSLVQYVADRSLNSGTNKSKLAVACQLKMEVAIAFLTPLLHFSACLVLLLVSGFCIAFPFSKM